MLAASCLQKTQIKETKKRLSVPLTRQGGGSQNYSVVPFKGVPLAVKRAHQEPAMCLPTPRISAAKRHDGKALTAAGNAKGALGHPPVDTSRVTARAERSKRKNGRGSLLFEAQCILFFKRLDFTSRKGGEGHFILSLYCHHRVSGSYHLCNASHGHDPWHQPSHPPVHGYIVQVLLKTCCRSARSCKQGATAATGDRRILQQKQNSNKSWAAIKREN